MICVVLCYVMLCLSLFLFYKFSSSIFCTIVFGYLVICLNSASPPSGKFCLNQSPLNLDASCSTPLSCLKKQKRMPIYSSVSRAMCWYFLGGADGGATQPCNCMSGQFCNFDSPCPSCEYCDSYNDANSCTVDGLPTDGALDCQMQCFGECDIIVYHLIQFDVMVWAARCSASVSVTLQTPNISPQKIYKTLRQIAIWPGGDL